MYTWTCVCRALSVARGGAPLCMALSTETLTSQRTLLLALPRAGSCRYVTVHGGRGLQQYILELDDATDGGGWVKVSGWGAEAGGGEHILRSPPKAYHALSLVACCRRVLAAPPCTCRGVGCR